MKYRQNKEIAWRAIEGEAILFDTQAGMMRQLNPVGSVVWEALEDERTTEELVALVCARFEVTAERALDDVTAFLPALLERNLVRTAP